MSTSFTVQKYMTSLPLMILSRKILPAHWVEEDRDDSTMILSSESPKSANDDTKERKQLRIKKMCMPRGSPVDCG